MELAGRAGFEAWPVLLEVRRLKVARDDSCKGSKVRRSIHNDSRGSCKADQLNLLDTTDYNALILLNFSTRQNSRARFEKSPSVMSPAEKIASSSSSFKTDTGILHQLE